MQQWTPDKSIFWTLCVIREEMHSDRDKKVPDGEFPPPSDGRLKADGVVLDYIHFHK